MSGSIYLLALPTEFLRSTTSALRTTTHPRPAFGCVCKGKPHTAARIDFPVISGLKKAFHTLLVVMWPSVYPLLPFICKAGPVESIR